MAVNRFGKEITDFIPCVAWNKTAEILSQWTAKGERISIIGQIQTRKFEQNGNKRTAIEVIVDEFEFLEHLKKEKTEDKPQEKNTDKNEPGSTKKCCPVAAFLVE